MWLVAIVLDTAALNSNVHLKKVKKARQFIKTNIVSTCTKEKFKLCHKKYFKLFKFEICTLSHWLLFSFMK